MLTCFLFDLVCILCVFVGSAIGILCAYLLYKFANPQNTPWYIYAITWLGCHSSPFAKHILVTCRTASAVSGCGLALFEISAASSTALTLSHPPPLAPEPALLPCALAAGFSIVFLVPADVAMGMWKECMENHTPTQGLNGTVIPPALSGGTSVCDTE